MRNRFVQVNRMPNLLGGMTFYHFRPVELRNGMLYGLEGTAFDTRSDYIPGTGFEKIEDAWKIIDEIEGREREFAVK
jgi:hypothetical protein